MQHLKKYAAPAGATLLVLLVALGILTVARHHRAPPSIAQGFSSIGQSSIGGGGGGLSKVTNTTGGILSGSGTASNPELATITVGGILSGTGSAGSAIIATEVGDISSVGAGSGLINGGTTGAVTLDVGAGSGIVVAADTVSTNAGSGLTYSSGALITNAGSGLTYSSGALITNAGSGITYSSGALIANLGTGLTYSAGAIVPNQTAVTCTNGRGVVSTAASGTATCGYVGANAYEGTHFEWHDDLIYGYGGGGSVTSPGPFGFVGSVSSTGALAPTTSTTTTRFGIWEMSTGLGATTARDTQSSFGNIVSAFTTIDMASGLWEMDATVGFPALSTSSDEWTFYIGFGDAVTSPNMTDGCGFLYDRGNVATNGNNSGNASDWEISCAKASTRVVYLLNGQTEAAGDGSYVTTTQAIAALTFPDTNWYRLKIVEVSTSQVDFYVNGTKSGTIASATHIPSGASGANVTGVQMVLLKSAGTAVAGKADIDEVTVKVDLNAARSP